MSPVNDELSKRSRLGGIASFDAYSDLRVRSASPDQLCIAESGLTCLKRACWARFKINLNFTRIRSGLAINADLATGNTAKKEIAETINAESGPAAGSGA